MSEHSEEAEAQWAEALADGLIDMDGNLTDKGLIASRKMGAFPGASPFYDKADERGKIEIREDEPQKERLFPSRPLRRAEASVVDPQEIYFRLDRALALYDDDPNSAINDLYDLRDEIYRTLR